MDRRAMFLTLTAFVAACGEPFDPRNELTRYQVLGVVADRPEPGPDDAVQLRVHEHLPEGASSTYAWKVCLYSLGAVVAYECADPSLETAIEADGPTATLDLGPNGLNLRALYDEYGPVTDAEGNELTFEDGLPIWVKLTSGPGAEVQSVKRLLVREGHVPNRNPGVVAVKAGDTELQDGTPVDVRIGETVTLELVLAPDAAETYVAEEESDGETARVEKTEELLYTWFTTAGSLSPGSTFGDDRDTELDLSDEEIPPGEATLHVAVRDGRGGLTIVERPLRVLPAR